MGEWVNSWLYGKTGQLSENEMMDWQKVLANESNEEMVYTARAERGHSEMALLICAVRCRVPCRRGIDGG